MLSFPHSLRRRSSRLLRTDRAARAAVSSLETRLLFAGYSIVDLGSLSGGASTGGAINQSGVVAGASSTAALTGGTSDTHATLFGTSSLTDLQTAGAFTDSAALALNDSGQAAGYSGNGAGLPAATGAHAAVFANGAATDLGTLTGGAYSAATGINNAGEIVGYSQTTLTAGPEHAFIDDALVAAGNPSLVDLGTLSGNISDSSRAYAINNSSVVVGDSTAANGQTHAFYDARSGNAGTMVDLGEFPGGNFSSARAINDAGTIVGVAATSVGLDHAFESVNHGALIDLGTLPGDHYSIAEGVNQNGDAVGASAPRPPAPPPFRTGRRCCSAAAR